MQQSLFGDQQYLTVKLEGQGKTQKSGQEAKTPHFKIYFYRTFFRVFTNVTVSAKLGNWALTGDSLGLV